jgi:hypothetical protein
MVYAAVNHLESGRTNDLFFSIKATPKNGIVIPFTIRTHWGYTRWSKISFSFLAESSS